jgi:hypothetical protein
VDGSGHHPGSDGASSHRANLLLDVEIELDDVSRELAAVHRRYVVALQNRNAIRNHLESPLGNDADGDGRTA